MHTHWLPSASAPTPHRAVRSLIVVAAELDAAIRAADAGQVNRLAIEGAALTVLRTHRDADNIDFENDSVHGPSTLVTRDVFDDPIEDSRALLEAAQYLAHLDLRGALPYGLERKTSKRRLLPVDPPRDWNGNLLVTTTRVAPASAP